MQFVVTLVGEVEVQNGNGESVPDVAEAVESHLDQVMDELENLGAGDPRIDLELAEPVCVAFAVLVDATNPIGAVSQASGLLRTAVHAAGGATPDWPGPYDESWSVRLVGVRSEAVSVERISVAKGELVDA